MGDPKLNPSLGMKITLAGIRNVFSGVAQISTTKFYDLWSQGRTVNPQRGIFNSENTCERFILFDVREQKERDISFIQGSVWINSLNSQECNIKKVKEVLANKLQELNSTQECHIPVENNQQIETAPQQEINIIAYCSIGYRSSDLIKQLLEVDLLPHNMSQVKINLYNLEGSLFKWANEDKPILDKDFQPTKFVHPYNVLWGKLLNESRRKSSL